MPFLSGALTLTSSIFLIHSLFSIYEHNNLPPTTAAPASLPIDILIELLASTFFLILSLVLGAQPLRPIQWADWAGKIEREGWDPSAEARNLYAHKKLGAPSDPQTVAKGGAGNPFRMLEERKGFWDVQAERKAFADWVRQGAAAGGKK